MQLNDVILYEDYEFNKKNFKKLSQNVEKQR